jgi:hypothetical protein
MEGDDRELSCSADPDAFGATSRGLPGPVSPSTHKKRVGGQRDLGTPCAGGPGSRLSIQDLQVKLNVFWTRQAVQ